MNKIIFPIYYINLNRSEKRKKFMEDQFNNLKITFKRVEAIDGNNINVNYENLCRHKGNKYELACTLSHLKAIKQAYNDNIDNVLICEDDINFSLINKWKINIQQIIDLAPKDWKIIKLHNNNYKQIANKNTIPKIIPKQKHSSSTGLYLINRKGMEIIINKFYKETHILLKKKYVQADHLIYEPVYKFRTYEFNIPLVFNENYKSLISKSHNTFQIESINKIKNYY